MRLFPTSLYHHHDHDDIDISRTVWVYTSAPQSPGTNSSDAASVGNNSDVVIVEGELLSKEEIEALRERAKSLRAEALAMEAEMNDKRSKQRKQTLSETDQLLEALFPQQQWGSGLLFNESIRIANVLRTDRW